jgi:predicted transcriptional regulator
VTPLISYQYLKKKDKGTFNQQEKQLREIDAEITGMMEVVNDNFVNMFKDLKENITILKESQ